MLTLFPSIIRDYFEELRRPTADPTPPSTTVVFIVEIEK